MTARFRFFDLCVESELPVDGLPGCPGDRTPGRTPDWTVAPGQPAGGGAPPQWLHTWHAPGGQPVMAVARQGGRYLLEFFDLARFVIDFDEHRIEAIGAAGCTPATLAHLLLDQVLPRAVCHEGRMVVHASAVGLGDGRAVAFTGVSGRGKSTLAAAFLRAGHRLLSDDCLLLENVSGRVCALPAYGSLRLWEDSADALFSVSEQGRLNAAQMAHYSRKRVLRPAAEAVGDGDGRLPLEALFLLAPPAEAGDDAVRIEPAGGMDAIMALVEAQFALDVSDQEAIRRGFEAVKRVAGGAPVFRLRFPRRYDRLPGVVDKVMTALSRSY
jgi:hypothetical protein